MRSVLLVSNNEALGLKVLYCLRQAGFRVDVASVAPRNGTRFSRYCRNFDRVPEAEKDDDQSSLLFDWISERASSRDWTAILGDDIRSHGLLNTICRGLSVPAFAPSPRSLLDGCHNKWSFYCKFKSGPVRVPNSLLVDDVAAMDPNEVKETVGFPLLVKPLDAESSHGICRFDDFETLAAYLKTPGPYKKLPLMLQQFIAGHTIGFSLLATSGHVRCHDVQLHAGDGSRVFYEDNEVEEAGRRIVSAFGYGGPAHIDFIRDDASGVLYALEFNSRFWFSVTVSMWRGGNFPALAVALARDHPIPARPTVPGAYFQPGTVVKLLKRPSMLAKLDGPNWRGFLQAISDPLPHVINRFL